MNNDVTGLTETDKDILTCDVSDLALERARVSQTEKSQLMCTARTRGISAARISKQIGACRRVASM